MHDPTTTSSATAAASEPWRKNLGRDKTLFNRGDGVPDVSDRWWTGKAPSVCPGVLPSGQMTALPSPNLADCTVETLLDYFDNSWTLTEVLFRSLVIDEAFFRPPDHGLRHPLIFYYGHPAVVYVNKLRVAGLLVDPVDPHIESICEVGVDEMSWDDLGKNDRDWPSVSEILEYRRAVYRLLVDTIKQRWRPPVSQHHPCWAVVLGIEHEHIHLETSAMLMRELPLRFVRKPQQWPNAFPYSPVTSKPTAADFKTTGDDSNAFVRIAGSHVDLGKPIDFPSFGWDCEYGERPVATADFEVSRFQVTNADFLKFVEAQGYHKRQYWTLEGWGWRSFRNVKWPCFWVPKGPQGLSLFDLRVQFELIPMQWSWPAIVNVHESKAFLAWLSDSKGFSIPARLLTEAEHHLLHDINSSAITEAADDPVMVFDGPHMFTEQGANMNLAFGSEGPVDCGKPSSKGVYGVWGNVWQWCEDHFCAFPGYEVHPVYNDFSSPCFDGRHYMMMGGAFVSAGNLASIYARYAFRAHFYQNTGLRVVRPLVPTFTTCCINASPHVGTSPCCTGVRSVFDTDGKANEVVEVPAHAISAAIQQEHLAQTLTDALSVIVAPMVGAISELSAQVATLSRELAELRSQLHNNNSNNNNNNTGHPSNN